ncbi:MAG TPA: hypothetical protein VGT02_16185 [Methylomirabilota bacterium]|jgi:hypothetical protein|nr:hypothetical protein [Methylomirabilota bacterium]
MKATDLLKKQHKTVKALFNEEHHVVDLVLAELPQVDPEDERFAAKMLGMERMAGTMGVKRQAA